MATHSAQTLYTETRRSTSKERQRMYDHFKRGSLVYTSGARIILGKRGKGYIKFWNPSKKNWYVRLIGFGGKLRFELTDLDGNPLDLVLVEAMKSIKLIVTPKDLNKIQEVVFWQAVSFDAAFHNAADPEKYLFHGGCMSVDCELVEVKSQNNGTNMVPASSAASAPTLLKPLRQSGSKGLLRGGKSLFRNVRIEQGSGGTRHLGSAGVGHLMGELWEEGEKQIPCEASDEDIPELEDSEFEDYVDEKECKDYSRSSSSPIAIDSDEDYAKNVKFEKASKVDGQETLYVHNYGPLRLAAKATLNANKHYTIDKSIFDLDPFGRAAISVQARNARPKQRGCKLTIEFGVLGKEPPTTSAAAAGKEEGVGGEGGSDKEITLMPGGSARPAWRISQAEKPEKAKAGQPSDPKTERLDGPIGNNVFGIPTLPAADGASAAAAADSAAEAAPADGAAESPASPPAAGGIAAAAAGLFKKSSKEKDGDSSKKDSSKSSSKSDGKGDDKDPKKKDKKEKKDPKKKDDKKDKKKSALTASEYFKDKNRCRNPAQFSKSINVLQIEE